MTKTNIREFNLEERTAKFGENIIKLVRTIPENTISKPVLSQLIRSGTSVGANYCEADDAESRQDFIHKIGICKKEARETKHWIRMLVTIFPQCKEEARIMWKEAKELNLIFNAIRKSAKTNSKLNK